MKTRINLTIDKDILSVIKAFVMRNNTTVSELVETQFRLIAMKQLRKSNLIEKVEKLKIPPIDPSRDLIAEYYEAMGKKHSGKSVSRRKRNT
jgi:hypothetical protein